MNTPYAVYYQFNQPQSADDFLQALSKIFTLQVSEAPPLTYQLLLDSKWSLWHKNLLLCQTSDHHLVLQTKTLEILKQASKAAPKFSWDIPNGDIKDKIKKPLGLRALQVTSQIDLSETPVALLNEDDKIICRLLIIKAQNSNNSADEPFGYCKVMPLRGYSKEAKKTISLCDQYLEATDNPPSLKYFFSQQPLDITEKKQKNFGIDPQLEAEKVVRSMAYSMLLEAQSYEQGIIDDIDTEFLHDYRIALRKARSLVALTKPAFNQEEHATIKKLMADMARPTNEQRDLDVFILDESNYRKLLPESFKPGLDLLFDKFKQERSNAFTKVVNQLRSNAYKNIRNELEQILSAPANLETKASKTPIVKVAKKQILRRYQKIRCIGLLINESTPDEEVHELRIECKKLRYLMAFFAELFPAEQLSQLRKPLTNLQNILGKFNDYSVQKEFLQAHTNQRQAKTLLVAVSGLVAVLHQKQLEQRDRVCTAFSEFGDETTAQQFLELFGPSKTPTRG